ncbi:hypothetical protein [Pedobacter nototheniae]|uniref:hypothetical protein n=1 Tax=Pedobacter nototheniae TaxID=2488994 RepID=UPI001038A70B|nr:hypothetical protein [Pedobacter nototheniae]
MITSIYVIKAFADQIISHSQQVPQELVLAFRQECERFRALLSEMMFSIEDPDKLSLTFSIHHQELTGLANKLFLKANASGKTLRIALEIVVDLLRFIEEKYGGILGENALVCAFTVKGVSREVSALTTELKMKLQHKGVSAPLLFQLFKAHDDLFRENRYPAFTTGNLRYLETIAPQIQKFANDKREKDWNKKLRQLLIKYNFNHMGLYNFFENEHQQQVLQGRTTLDRQRLLYKKVLAIEQIQVLPNLSYDPNAERLKDMLLKHLHLMQEMMKDEVKTGKQEVQKLRYNVSVNELALDFHYRYGEKEFIYKTKKEAAQAFCQNNSSKQVNDISPHSMLKFDKLEQYDAAIKLYQRNLRIQNRLIEDFGLKD